MIDLLLALSLSPAPLTPAQDAALDWIDAKRTIHAGMPALTDELTDVSRRVWEWAELALTERRSSEALADMLMHAGFAVERGISDMETAWVASYGSGEPVIAYLAEFDALPSLSQTATTSIEARIPGEPGHGCGHNLFGAGSVGAGIALKQAMQAHDLPGTVRVYGTPAEEHGIGKVFLVRDGHFDDVDVCLSWHPSNENEVSLQPSMALRSFEVSFYGRSAHAAGAPWEAVSALDAVEAFETGLNLLREHMPESARIHYVVTNGGEAPNVVPNEASVWLFTRGADWPEQERVYQHVMKIVEGADLMAWGEEHGDVEAGYQAPLVQNYTGLYHYNPNELVARVMHANLELVGPAAFTEQEHAFARDLQVAFGLEPLGMHSEIEPFDPDAAPESGGSTDVANISWVCPTIDLNVATWPMKVPAHSWASTAASGSSAGYRGMLTAAEVLACTGVDFLMDSALVSAAQEEFARSSASFPYVSPVGPDDLPSLPTSMRED